MKNIICLLTIALSGFGGFAQDNADNRIDVKFMVFSDPHYYDSSLGTEGEAFEAYLEKDRKLLKESDELVKEAVKIIESSDASFVIIPGDLTKDGTSVSHKSFSEYLFKIELSGKQVYVVPGNHDINNGHSYSYKGDTAILAKNVGPEDFKKLYARYGYEEAVHTDKNSLSYIVEPVKGIWLLALDPCLYAENQPGQHPETDGEFNEKTLDWVLEVALEAKERNKKIIAMMHHGILEHYQKQDRFFGEYVVDDFRHVSEFFASLDINVVFTGHYHAQDITIKKWPDGKFIIDVETGSLVTYPCPVREVELFNDTMIISSEYITSIPSHEEDFVEFSRNYAHEGIAGIAEEVMISMGLKPEDALKLSGQIGDAFIAHYQGDETQLDKTLDLEGVGLMGRFLILFKKRMIRELHSDLHPADNHVKIDLNTGEVVTW